MKKWGNTNVKVGFYYVYFILCVKVGFPPNRIFKEQQMRRSTGNFFIGELDPFLDECCYPRSFVQIDKRRH